MYVFNFFRNAILISYTAGFHEGRLFSYLQVYKNEEKTIINPQTQREYYPVHNVHVVTNEITIINKIQKKSFETVNRMSKVERLRCSSILSPFGPIPLQFFSTSRMRTGDFIALLPLALKRFTSIQHQNNCDMFQEFLTRPKKDQEVCRSKPFVQSVVGGRDRHS